MTIDGCFVNSSDTFSVENPATGALLGEAPQATAAQVDQAMEAAATAFESKWSTDESLRKSCLTQAGDIIAAAADELGRLLTMEQGKPLNEATAEVMMTAKRLQYFATQENPVERVMVDDIELEINHVPLGPVAAITPWNSPLITSANKFGAALAMGNTVILKPSPFTPLSTLRVGELLREVLPPGVLNVLSGLEPLGQLMTEHPTPRKVSLTGSVETGKAVGVAAAHDFKRATLELGGNDAAIVLDDADPEAIVDGIFAATFGNAGQVCVAIKRLYIADALHDRICELLVKRAKQLVVGDGLDPATQMGPLTTRAQRDHVVALVSDATAKGAMIACGGHSLPGPGNFYAPTVVADAQTGMRLVDEEQFGPVLPIIRYSELDAAIAQMNSSIYGLGASVWGSDPERCRRVAAEVSAGVVWLNAHKVLAGYQPLAGMRSSGIGVQGGALGLAEYTAVKVVWSRSARVEVAATRAK